MLHNTGFLRSITYYANGLEGKQDGAKEEWKILDLSNHHAVVKRQRLSEDKVKYNGESSEHDGICDRRERCQELEIPDGINEDQGYQ